MKNLMSALFSAVSVFCLFAAIPAVAHDDHSTVEKKTFTKISRGHYSILLTMPRFYSPRCPEQSLSQRKVLTLIAATMR
jgi:hypothetical protein